MVEAFAFVRRFWPFGVIFALTLAVLWLRGDNASLKGRAEQAETRAATLQEVNDQNAAILKGFSEQRLANDEIIRQLTGARSANATRATEARSTIEKAARNDKAVGDWFNQPVPIGVLRVVNTPRR